MIKPDPMIELLNRIPESQRKNRKKLSDNSKNAVKVVLSKYTPNILIENTIQHLRELITCEMCAGDIVMGEGAIKIECYEECIKLLEDLIYGRENV